MKRRDFLKGAAVAPAAVAVSRWSVAAEALGATGQRVSAVVYDERYSDCRVFADTFTRHGAARFAIAGDAGSLWYGALREHLSQHGGSVAGMTTDSDLGVSRECGREIGMRIGYEGSHDGRSAGLLKHLLRGDDRANAVYAALLRDDGAWAASIAAALPSATLADRIVAMASTPTLTTAQNDGYRGYLTSWLITPA